ncbi:TetR/AcrR family transcriptional regulator [Actinokineospora sp. PR83]|uniref:TetR/AcrR family transcriptional regulator n=1 Tax=Actinokineospora sp. PR83 TaxID=2884908 RepID=UPI0027DF1002|nr:TetR/AcrR family transcriptional regulator [Actinokineospora sp. PR83]MCG8916062.1 TetR/AcrR family transcriptional regulator [Actinokineospora sp. PR83]
MNSREHILDSALALLRSGGSVSLESAAREAGLSKPGLMHHFRTKEALMLALVDHVVDGWERALAERLTGEVARASAGDRIRAYLAWSTSGGFDEADLVVVADPRLRPAMTARWEERLGPWLALPDDLDPDARARLTAVRLLCDGAWLADAAHLFPIPPDERDRVRAVAERLLEP